MKRRNVLTTAATALTTIALVATMGACEEPKKTEPSAKPSAVAPAPPPEPEKPLKIRPLRNNKLDIKLNDERRAKIEKAIPDALGFIPAAEIEAKIHKKKLEEEEPALEAFDKEAKGKWLLFVGNMIKMTDSGFEMAVSYTPQAEGDPMGMSRKFFMVSISDVKGYEKSKFKDGERGVVLAKYAGDKKASPAYEVIELEHW